MEQFQIDEDYSLILNHVTKLWDVNYRGQILPHSAPQLYKYYSLSVNNIGALLSNYFYLSNPSDFNDPFDCNLNLIYDYDSNFARPDIKRNNLGNVGVCSFTENITDPLMWAHYTNNYSGFALEFQGDSVQMLLRQGHIEDWTFARVIYPENPALISKHFPFALHYLLTTKFNRWSYEREWRFICTLLEKDRQLNYDPACVKGIYIGHKIPDEQKSAYDLLLEIQEIRFPKTPIYVVYPNPTKLELILERVWN